MTVNLKVSPKQSAYKVYCQKQSVSDVTKKLSALNQNKVSTYVQTSSIKLDFFNSSTKNDLRTVNFEM